MSMTGHPARQIALNIADKGGVKRKTISLNKLQFPACEDCNNEYSSLETKTKRIVERLSAREGLSPSDIDLLLDWLDKIRVGLWLGHRTLQKNPWGIEPLFHISSRIGIKDRMVAIHFTSHRERRLLFTGTDLPLFAHTPSCFALQVNQLVMFNLSYEFLFAKRLGLPYPRRKYLRPDRLVEMQMVRGTERLAVPLLRPQLGTGGVEFYQPGMPRLGESADLYGGEYVRKHYLNGSTSRGVVIGPRMMRCEKEDLIDFGARDVPEMEYEAVNRHVCSAVLRWQIRLMDFQPSLRKLDISDQKRIRARKSVSEFLCN